MVRCSIAENENRNVCKPTSATIDFYNDKYTEIEKAA